MKQSILFLVVLMTVSSCSDHQTNRTDHDGEDPSSISADDVFVFDCNQDFAVTAYFTTDSVQLFLPDSTLSLPQITSASGAKYESEDGSSVFWTKGDEALLETGDVSFQSCKNNPQEGVWEAARLSGVNFRALGQEPGWVLEIGRNNNILYAHNYGQDTVKAPAPSPIIGVDDESAQSYQTRTEDHTLFIEIFNRPCSDAMSGFSFPATVEVTLDGNTLSGCGRWLQPQFN